jgi:hypothetical protein
VLLLDTNLPHHLDVRQPHHDFLHTVHLQGAHAAFHGGGKNLVDAGTLLDQLVISSRCTDALSTSSIQPFRSEQINLLMITATNRYDNDHQSLFHDFIDQPITGISEFDFVSILKVTAQSCRWDVWLKQPFG